MSVTMQRPRIAAWRAKENKRWKSEEDEEWRGILYKALSFCDVSTGETACELLICVSA